MIFLDEMNNFISRIRAVQFGMRSATLVEDPASQADNNNAATANNNSNSSGNNLRRLQQGRESFRHLHQVSISSTFYAHLLQAQFPKEQKNPDHLTVLLHFWNLRE